MKMKNLHMNKDRERERENANKQNCLQGTGSSQEPEISIKTQDWKTLYQEFKKPFNKGGQLKDIRRKEQSKVMKRHANRLDKINFQVQRVSE